ncbi:MAG: zinc-binding alcohol dehydrogenase [Microbacteriaceae bacterium]|nr:zinc-binding alcohol dehydrogenase [Microbacteriaceae bacterium]
MLGFEMDTLALWCIGDSKAELRQASVGEGVLVENVYSGISRGTERLVFEGQVPKSEFERMRCFGQQGDFSFPIKFGYCSVVKVLEGELAGKHAFTLYPHQQKFRTTTEKLHLLPDEVPAERAVLAANMETALNVTWDSQVSAGDKVVVIGAGVLGLLVGFLLAKMPATDVTVIDKNKNRASLAKKLQLKFADTENSPNDCDVVINTSASSAGLSQAIEIAGNQAKIIEASWYGTEEVSLPLGGAFHSRRLSLISSQVGQIPENKIARWDYQRRMSTALGLLNDPVLDVLISGESKFENLDQQYSEILHNPETLCHRVRY